MNRDSTLALLLIVLASCATPSAGGATGDLRLAVRVFDSELVLETSSEFAGAVSSLTFRGKEHIDSRDHGRLLQSASSFDGYGECFNPTEGGAAHNSANENASVLKAARVEGNQLWTTTDMAFWLSPRQPYPRGCGTRKSVKHAVNDVPTSGHWLDKHLTIGLPDFPNVIEHRVTFHVPADFSYGTFEASTAYVPKEFSLALYYDAASGVEVEPGNRQGEQAMPVILSTPDKRYAMGVYAPQLPQNRFGYGRFTFPDVNKWNCVFREKNVRPGNYNYQCLIVLGTLYEVEDTLLRLHNRYQKSTIP